MFTMNDRFVIRPKSIGDSSHCLLSRHSETKVTRYKQRLRETCFDDGNTVGVYRSVPMRVVHQRIFRPTVLTTLDFPLARDDEVHQSVFDASADILTAICENKKMFVRIGDVFLGLPQSIQHKKFKSTLALPDSQCVVALDDTNKLHIVDYGPSAETRYFQTAHNSSKPALLDSMHNEKLALVALDSQVHSFDLRSHSKQPANQFNSNNTITGLIAHPDADHFSLLSSDDMLSVFDIKKSDKPVYRREQVSAMCWLPGASNTLTIAEKMTGNIVSCSVTKPYSKTVFTFAKCSRKSPSNIFWVESGRRLLTVHEQEDADCSVHHFSKVLGDEFVLGASFERIPGPVIAKYNAQSDVVNVLTGVQTLQQIRFEAEQKDSRPLRKRKRQSALNEIQLR